MLEIFKYLRAISYFCRKLDYGRIYNCHDALYYTARFEMSGMKIESVV